MIATINNYKVNLSKPIDISLPITANDKNPIAWYQNPPEITPVIMEDFIGKVASGKSATNFNNILFNPHAHGTHTECLGHITHDFYSINDALQKFFFSAELVSIVPENIGEDLVITKNQLKKAIQNKNIEALVIRTLPNSLDKKSKNYSNTNPAYLAEDAAIFLRDIGIQHFLIDLPSIDKEKDKGLLLAHKAFWNVTDTKFLNSQARKNATITEMIFVPNEVLDGQYLLNLQIVSFVNDASPSKPVLYSLE
jgi:kynurenine formamidase